MEIISQYIEPQYAILVAVLYCVGGVIKRTDAVNCRWIPAVLTLIGIGLAALNTFGSGAYDSVAAGLYQSVGQGVLCAGMSVYLNQLIKQTGCKK